MIQSYAKATRYSSVWDMLSAARIRSKLYSVCLVDSGKGFA